ncbi:hypothetical protein C1H46_030140 [Malus baccata]|uniref:Uncharacterized protein n=1 Tax=Malus baccata TaxID=106549 RepID=A0A540LDE9_MALBA|nr:hypothetical protein C1H46_030140 [Malus baccata]
MGAICCLEKAGLRLQQGSSQNDGRRGQTFSKVLKREEVGQIKILEVQEWSFYWWRFKCALELNASPYKNLHSTELQKSKRRLLRNRRGVCFLKSWAAQRPRGSISEIEEAFAFSKAGLLKDHEEIEEALAFSKAGLLRDHEGRSQQSKGHLLFHSCQHLSHAHSAMRKLWAFCRRLLVK